MAQLNDDIDETLLEKPCRFCHDLYPEIVLLQHQDICQALIQQVCSAAEIERRDGNGVSGQNLGNINTTQKDDDVDVLLMDVGCFICGMLYPALVMPDHQAICRVLNLPVEEQYFCDEEIQQSNSIPEESQMNSNISDAAKEKKTEVKVQSTKECKAEKAGEIKIKEEANVVKIKESNVEQIKKKISFGNNADFPEDFVEKQNYSKNQSNAFYEYADQNDDEEDLNISDDDYGESLEDFWVEARNLLKCQKFQNA